MLHCPVFPRYYAGGWFGFFHERCGREVVEVQGEGWWFPSCSVFVGECGEKVCVYWELPDLCGMGLEPVPPVGCVVVGGGKKVGVIRWGLLEVVDHLGNDGEGGVDIDGLVVGPCDGEEVGVCVGVMIVS